MRILLDTNIVMDALQERQPFDTAAKEILWRAQNGELSVSITANGASDIFYLYSKARDIQTARTAMDFLFATYGVVSVTQEDCKNAMKLPILDFEDALVAECARKAEMDYIVTRDDKFLQSDSAVTLIIAEDLLKLLK